MRPLLLSVSVAAILMGLTACEQQSQKSGPQTGKDVESGQIKQASLPEGLFVDAAPEGGRGVGEVKADTEVTGDVVIVGRIGGRVEPFVPGAAMFLITDAKLLSCDQMGEKDHCKTPWDYCCEPRDSLLANTATVQVVGEDGKPLALGLKDVSGLKPLVTVTVVGSVAAREDGGTLVVNAKHIYVAKESVAKEG